MSACEIKVLYLGKNRNQSLISKDVAEEMAKTLRGAPIVGYYKEEVGDFRDHGDLITIDGDSISFACQTKPYGFVSPDAKVWFQDFIETDEDGTEAQRTYLMTTGYLWTGQFEECKSVITEGRPQSMELDGETLEGQWTKLANEKVEFFIVNDAIFSKLCILGKDVEPCFEGAMVTGQTTQFSKNSNFGATLYTMMNELKEVLKGGQSKMDTENLSPEFKKKTDEEPEKETPAKNNVEVNDDDKKKKCTKSESQAELEDDKDTSKDNDKQEDSNKENKDDSNKENKDDDKNKKKDYALLETQFTALKEQMKALQEKNEELLAFKKQVETAKKDEMIASFYMLSDADKEDVIKNKDKYSLDDIESKLSVICVRKKVNFNLDDSTENDNKVENENDSIITYNLNDAADSTTPEWIKALRRTAALD